MTQSQSTLIYGCMGLGGGWNDQPVRSEDVKKVHTVIDSALECGIRLFDHADIYTFGKAEQAFGKALKERPELDNELRIQSKCGIRFADELGPKRYDFSTSWIVSSVDSILSRLGVEQIDTLLLHRPDPLMVVDEVASAVATLQASGKIKNLGVSNMNAHQMSYLQSALSTPIVCNQMEMSLTKLDWLEEGITAFSSSTLGTLEYCQANNIEIQAWGSLSQGLFSGRELNGQPDNIVRTATYVRELAEHYHVSSEAIVLAWLQRHPANIRPVIGTTAPHRIKACAQSDTVTLSREQWYTLYELARAAEMP
jgi:predicted oxidoreductase